MEIAIRSCYVCITDMARAIRFYEALLERPVKERDETYSVLEVGGFRLGLFAFRPAGEERAYGTNCLPSLELPCCAALMRKLAGQRVVFPLRRIGPNWVSEIEGSAGNRLELTAPGKAQACKWISTLTGALPCSRTPRPCGPGSGRTLRFIGTTRTSGFRCRNFCAPTANTPARGTAG